jgi:hypothetical protein
MFRSLGSEGILYELLNTSRFGICHTCYTTLQLESVQKKRAAAIKFSEEAPANKSVLTPNAALKNRVQSCPQRISFASRAAGSLLALACVLASHSGVGRTTALLNVLWDSWFVMPSGASHAAVRRVGVFNGNRL